MNDIKANAHIANLSPYQPGKPVEEVMEELGIQNVIKLASNENALGPSAYSLAAIQNTLGNLHIYPNGAFLDFKQTLAKFLITAENQITIGNGSENILEIIVKTFLSVEDEAIISQYCFMTIPLLIKACGAKVVTAPVKNFNTDVEGILSEITKKTRMVFIVNPNNPTGTYTSETELKNLLDSIPKNIIVVLDEAYYEYITEKDFPNSIELLKHYSNLIITRTFSKAYGLAGLRLGYAISSSYIADLLNRARLPFNVNSIAMAAGKAALSDQDHIKRSLLMNKSGMQQLLNGLRKLNLKFIPSQGNFITINLEQDGEQVFQELLKSGVIVRPLASYNLANYIRVTIGKEEQNMHFLNALENVLRREACS